MPLIMAALTNAYLEVAAIGGVLLAIGFMMGWLGFSRQPGIGHDPVGHRGANLVQEILALNWRFTLLPLVFGLTGLAGQANELGEPLTMNVAIGVTTIALAISFWLPFYLQRLEKEAARHMPLLGQPGVVLQTVPERFSGTGRVLLRAREQEVEFLAVTSGPELANAASIVLVKRIDKDTVEVLGDHPNLSPFSSERLPQRPHDG